MSFWPSEWNFDCVAFVNDVTYDVACPVYFVTNDAFLFHRHPILGNCNYLRYGIEADCAN